MTLRVGIISANWGAFAHLPAWRCVPGVEVVAICTSHRESAEAAAKKHRIAAPFWDAQQMAAHPDIDVIDCGTRPNLRDAMVLSALRNGKHVYNAIPFSSDLDHARELHSAWKASGKTAVVDAFSEWLPAHRMVKDMVDEGYLGQPFGGSCIFNMSLFNKPNAHFPYNWFSQAGLGVSAMRNLGSHALHMLLFLFGEVEELVARESRLLTEWRFPDGKLITPETNDFANMLIRFESGLTMQLQVSWSATLGSGWTLEAFGSRGRFIISAPSFPTSRDTTVQAGTLDNNRIEAISIPQRLLQSPDMDVGYDVEPQPVYPMALSMQRMTQAALGKGAARPDFDQAWRVECVLEAVRRSTQERRWVRLSEIS